MNYIMMHSKQLLIAIIIGAAFLLSSCGGDSEASFVGKYAAEPEGEVVFEIVKGDTSLVVDIYDKRTQKARGDQKPLQKLTSEQLSQAYQGDEILKYLGNSYGTAGFVISKVTDGKGFAENAKQMKVDPEANFFARVILFPMNAYKVD